jgi:hypothetical protein
VPDGRADHGAAVPTEGNKSSANVQEPTPRRSSRLARHLGELRGEVSMVAEQIVVERNEAAKAKGKE